MNFSSPVSQDAGIVFVFGQNGDQPAIALGDQQLGEPDLLEFNGKLPEGLDRDIDEQLNEQDPYDLKGWVDRFGDTSFDDDYLPLRASDLFEQNGDIPHDDLNVIAQPVHMPVYAYSDDDLPLGASDLFEQNIEIPDDYLKDMVKPVHMPVYAFSDDDLPLGASDLLEQNGDIPDEYLNDIVKPEHMPCSYLSLVNDDYMMPNISTNDIVQELGEPSSLISHWNGGGPPVTSVNNIDKQLTSLLPASFVSFSNADTSANYVNNLGAPDSNGHDIVYAAMLVNDIHEPQGEPASLVSHLNRGQPTATLVNDNFKQQLLAPLLPASFVSFSYADISTNYVNLTVPDSNGPVAADILVNGIHDQRGEPASHISQRNIEQPHTAVNYNGKQMSQLLPASHVSHQNIEQQKTAVKYNGKQLSLFLPASNVSHLNGGQPATPVNDNAIPVAPHLPASFVLFSNADISNNDVNLGAPHSNGQVPAEMLDDDIHQQLDEEPAPTTSNRTRVVTTDNSTDMRCPVCLKTYKTRVALSRHIKTHYVVKTFDCNECNPPTSYATKTEFTAHMMGHPGPFACEICPAKFVGKVYLNCHQSQHDIIGLPHQCPTCLQRFKQNSNLKRHLRAHDDIRAYHCAICKKNFAQLSNLKGHIDTAHGINNDRAHQLH